MMDNQNHTFSLGAGEKITFPAGAQDPETLEPKFTVEISGPDHAKRQVNVDQILIDSQGKSLWVWNIENNSKWQVFVIIKENPEFIKDSK